METTAIVIEALDAMHLATTSEPADGFDVDFAPVFERPYARLFGALDSAGIDPVRPHCATYEQRDDGRIDVIAAVPIAIDANIVDLVGVEVTDLPAVPRAATLVNTGDMSDYDRTYQLLHRWIDDATEAPVGFSREIHLDCSGSRDQWVTDLQFVLAS